MKLVKIKDVERNYPFKLKENSKKIFIKGAFCRLNKAYECLDTDDISNWRYLKSTKEVYIDFEENE